MAPPDDTPFDPVFVVGYPRSGTTLLATLLGRHSKLAATPESHFVDEVTPGSQRKARRVVSDHDSILARYAESVRVKDFDLDADAVRSTFLQEEASYAALFQVLLEAFAQAHGKPRVVEKTPAHLPFVPVLLGWYPNAKVVCIVRDGRDAVASRMAQPWTHNNLRLHCLDWRRWVAMGDAFERRYPVEMIRISFEDLLSNPHETLDSVCRFIGEKFEEQQLDPAREAGNLIPEWEAEWKAKAGAPLDSERISAWRKNATPRDKWLMNSMMGATLERFGYSECGMEGCPPGLRVYHGLANACYRFMYHPLVKPHLARIKRVLRRLGVPVAERNIPETPVDAQRASKDNCSPD